MLSNLKEKFSEIFNESEEAIIFSPGRINIIGEHIDYNGGNVFPASISLGTYVLFSHREDQEIQLYSGNFEQEGVLEEHLGEYLKLENRWTNYVLGMLATFEKHGYQLEQGFNAYVYGDIPTSSGLSSSASLEVAFGVLINTLGNFNIPMFEIVKYAQEAERDFVGVNVGIMDMFAIGMGKENHAILLNTDTLEYSYYPLNTGDYSLVIMNTNKPRALTDSKYNERRAECEAALKKIQTKFSAKELCELTSVDLPEVKALLCDDVLFRRVQHVVTEQERTLNGKNAMQEGDISKLGQLLNESHYSLRDDYEVTGIELDTLTEAARNYPESVGARMTGAGFGGCAIALVRTTSINDFKKVVQQAYCDKTGYEASFYEAKIMDGTRVLA